MVHYEKLRLTIAAKLEVTYNVLYSSRRSWLLMVSVTACGGLLLLPYDIRKTIDTRSFCLDCTDTRFKWIGLDCANESSLMFRVFGLKSEQEESKRVKLETRPGVDKVKPKVWFKYCL